MEFYETPDSRIHVDMGNTQLFDDDGVSFPLECKYRNYSINHTVRVFNFSNF